MTPTIELAVRYLNALSGRDPTSVTAASEREEHIRITAFFKNVSERNNTIHEINVKDETLGNIQGMVTELMVPRTRSDRQSHTHHSGNFQLHECST